MGQGHAGCWLNWFKGKRGAPLDCISSTLGTAAEREAWPTGSHVHSWGPSNGFISVCVTAWRGLGALSLNMVLFIFFKGHITACICILSFLLLCFLFLHSKCELCRGRGSLSWSQHRDQCLAQKALRKRMTVPRHAGLNWGPLHAVLEDRWFSFLRIIPN